MIAEHTGNAAHVHRSIEAATEIRLTGGLLHHTSGCEDLGLCVLTIRGFECDAESIEDADEVV